MTNLRRWLLPQATGPWTAAEAVLFPVLALSSAYALNPHLATGIQVTPWLWIAPLLIALRYGLAPGLGSAAVLMSGSLLMRSFVPNAEPWPTLEMLAGLVTTLFAGQYASWWINRLDKSEAVSTYLSERVEEITRAFYVTRVSHDLLEESLITRPTSLRSVFESLRLLLNEQHGRVDPQSGKALLGVLANYCRIESADLFGAAKNVINPDPVASLGNPRQLIMNDPLVRQSLEDSASTYHTVEELSEGIDSPYRMCAPLQSSDEQLVGFLAVRDLPFLALQEENLLSISAILQYYADEAWARQSTAKLLRSLPSDCPPDFARECIKLSKLSERNFVRSSLVAFTIPSPGSTKIFEHIESLQRSLDLYWRSTLGADIRRMIVLLPLASEKASSGFIDRIERELCRRFGHDLQHLGGKARTFELTPGSPLPSILNCLETNDVRS